MKTMCRTLALTALAVLMSVSFKLASRAQEATMVIAAQAAPRNGTYFVLRDQPTAARQPLSPPYPCVPPGGGIVYQASQHRSDIFVVDQRANPQPDADLLSVLVTLRIQIAASAATATATSSKMSLLSEGGVPLSGEGEVGISSGGETYEFNGPVYTTGE